MPKLDYPGSLMLRRKGVWRWRVMIDGEVHHRTFKDCDSKTEAANRAKAEYYEIEQDSYRLDAGLPGKLTMCNLLDSFEKSHVKPLADTTKRTYASAVKRFKAFFEKAGDPLACDVRPYHILEYLAERAENVEPRTVQKDRTQLHTVFEYALLIEVASVNPVAKTPPVKADEREPVILTADQYEKLIAACKGDLLKLYCLTLGETGMRSDSEALWLRFDDVKLDDSFVWIETVRKGRRTKGGRGRWCPMTKRLTEAMRDHFAATRMKRYHGKRTEWVFHHIRDRRRAKAGARIGRLGRGIEGARDRAKLPADFTQHDLRHRRATTWLAEGKDVVKVKEALGHADLRTTMGYMHLAREHLKSLVSEPDLPAFLSSDASEIQKR